MLLRLLLASVLLLTGCTASDPEPAPEAWTVELSTAPTLLVLTAEQVYAASYGNGVGASQVYRVDRSTGRLAAQRTVAGQPNGLALGPDGELWLATLQLPDQPSGTGLQVLDPVRLQTRRTVLVEGIPLSIAFVAGQLWTGDARGASRLDPATGTTLQRVPLPHAVNRLVSTEPGLLAVGPQTLTLLDPATGATRATRSVPAYGSTTVAAAGDVLWVLHPDADDASVLQPYDARTLVPGPPAASPGRAGAAAYASGDRLWLSDPGGGRLLCADARSAKVNDERDLALTGPLVADDRSVLAARVTGLTALSAGCGAAD